MVAGIEQRHGEAYVGNRFDTDVGVLARRALEWHVRAYAAGVWTDSLAPAETVGGSLPWVAASGHPEIVAGPE